VKMYNRLVSTIAALAAFATVAPVRAQDETLIARVPFEFSVNNTNLPRDTYRLSRVDGHRELLLVRSERKGVFVRTNVERLPRDNAKPSLLFHRYGDQYFLREIRWEGEARLELPQTKAERDAAEGRTSRAGGIMQSVLIMAER
jgi:hypothetical protein